MKQQEIEYTQKIILTTAIITAVVSIMGLYPYLKTEFLVPNIVRILVMLGFFVFLRAGKNWARIILILMVGGSALANIAWITNITQNFSISLFFVTQGIALAFVTYVLVTAKPIKMYMQFMKKK